MRTLEEIAYDAAERALDKQERVLEELRARTGVLLAASSLAASFLGADAFGPDSPLVLVVVALAAFVASVSAGVSGLTPRRGLVFSVSGSSIYDQLYEHRDDLEEIHRRLARHLHRIWRENVPHVERAIRAYRVAAGALVAEVLALVMLMSDTLL